MGGISAPTVNTLITDLRPWITGTLLPNLDLNAVAGIANDPATISFMNNLLPKLNANSLAGIVNGNGAWVAALMGGITAPTVNTLITDLRPWITGTLMPNLNETSVAGIMNDPATIAFMNRLLPKLDASALAGIANANGAWLSNLVNQLNPTVLATLVRRDPLLLRFRVPERDAARIKPGQQATFRVREDSREFTAKVVHVAESADDTSRLVDITANIDDPSDHALRPGSFAEITVPVSSPGEAPVIPVGAVRPSERGFLAYVVEGDKAVERILTLGMRSADGRVEVLSGLKGGEMLVVRGSEALSNGVTVRIGAPAEAGAPPVKK